MNISRQSWHYKFLMKFGDSDLKFDLRRGDKKFTTCTYIRSVLMTAIRISAFVLWLALVVVAAVGLAACTAYTAFTFLSMGFTLPAVPTVPLLVGFVGCLVVFAVTMFVLIKLLLNLIFCWIDKLRAKSRIKKVKRESLMKQALKDKKDGICTLVTFSE